MVRCFHCILKFQKKNFFTAGIRGIICRHLINVSFLYVEKTLFQYHVITMHGKEKKSRKTERRTNVSRLKTLFMENFSKETEMPDFRNLEKRAHQ